jgi:hypothetical protein
MESWGISVGGDWVDGLEGDRDFVARVRAQLGIDWRLLIRQRRRLGGSRSMSIIDLFVYVSIARSSVAVASCK